VHILNCVVAPLIVKEVLIGVYISNYSIVVISVLAYTNVYPIIIDLTRSTPRARITLDVVYLLSGPKIIVSSLCMT
jgi:hypothetical protein